MIFHRPTTPTVLAILLGAAHCLAQTDSPLFPAPDTVPGIPQEAAAQPVAAEAGKSATSAAPIMNQPLVMNSFENVEMERLRIAEELVKTKREDALFLAEIARLQKKLASSSLSVAAPQSIPTDYRTFLSQNAGNIETSSKYYALLKSTLNHLTAENPYAARAQAEITNPQRAAGNLLELEKFDEDEGICRTIRGQMAGTTGGAVADRQRIFIIDKSLSALAQEKRDLERNFQVTYERSTLSGRVRGSDSERNQIKGKIDDVVRRESQLIDEKNGLSHVTREGGRKLQFQQYIIQLVLQQRNIHALIACGFYRQSYSRGDLAIDREKAYPSGKDTGSAKTSTNPFATALAAAATPATNIPVFDTITSVELYLSNRIRDAIKEREALDNMITEKQMSALESLLIKMVLTAKYQPELNTLPYRSRQLFLHYGEDMRALSDAVNARDYQEMRLLADKIEAAGTDAGMKDIRFFATEQPGKALYLVRQSELALRGGDRKAAQSMTDAAVRRAPMDPDVKAKIERLQETFVTNSKLADELDRILAAGDYKAAYDRANEFATIAGNSGDKEKKASYEQLLEKEKSIRTVLAKCDVFERHGSYPDMWIELSQLAPDLVKDARLVSRKSAISGKCPRFISAYQSATEHEQAGADSIALAWYLTALSEAPGNTDLTDKVKLLGTKNLNN